MAFDYFTVRSLALELEARLQGKRIVDARSAAVGRSSGSRDLSSSLAFTATGATDHIIAEFGHSPVLCIGTGPIPDCHGRADGAERYLRGSLVDSVLPDPRDRVIRVRLVREDEAGKQTYGLLIFELVERHPIATLVSERSGQVLGCWRSSMTSGSKDRRILTGGMYKPLPGQRRLLPSEDSYETFLEYVRESDRSLTIDRVIKSCFAGADAVVAANILSRAKMSAERRISELDEPSLSRLWHVAAMRYSGTANQDAFCWKGPHGMVFSALRPDPSAGGPEAVREFGTISEAIRHVRKSGRDRERTRERQIRRILKSTRRTIVAVEADLEAASQADEHDKMGSVLLSQLADVPSSVDVVELSDTFRETPETGAPKLRIELNPRLTPAENAARYLKLAAKLRRSLQILPQRLESLKEDERQLLDTLARIDAGHEMGEMPDVRAVSTAKPARQKGPRSAVSDRGPVARPRRYRTRTGWVVWAGRNNKENDLLTHHMAASDDIWFHASGYAGSHVVLRREGRRDEPSGETLVDAASVAAYWSRGRSAKKVPVVYTLVKHVSKPKGSPPGLALPRRVKSLIVEPSLLQEQGDDIPKGNR